MVAGQQGRVAVFDTVTNAPIDTDPGLPGIRGIVVGIGPGALAIDPQANRICVVDISSDTITLIDGATNARIDTNPILPRVQDLPAGDGRGSVAVFPATNRAYVGNAQANTLSVPAGDRRATTTNAAALTVPHGTGVATLTAPIDVAGVGPVGEGAVTCTVLRGAQAVRTGSGGVANGGAGAMIDLAGRAPALTRSPLPTAARTSPRALTRSPPPWRSLMARPPPPRTATPRPRHARRVGQ